MDRLDRRILAILQSDVSISNLELSDRVGLSPTPCARRVKQLEALGFIESRVAILSKKALGLGLTAYLQVSLDRHTKTHFKCFENEIIRFEEVVECNLITGQDADYLIKIVVPDLEYFQSFLLNHITEIEGVKGVQSSFVLQSPVQTTKMPLSHLGED